MVFMGNFGQVDSSVAGGMSGKFRGRSREGEEGEHKQTITVVAVHVTKYSSGGGLF